METNLLIGLGALVMAVVSGGLLVFYFVFPRNQVSFRSLMRSPAAGPLGAGPASAFRARLSQDPDGEEFEKLKALTKRRIKKKPPLTLEEKFFQAGIFSEEERKAFMRWRFVAPIIMAPLGAFAGSYAGSQLAIVAAILGLLVGLQLPFSILDRRIAQRNEDIMFFLPLVIEQIVIGVSSSLDVGPCIQRVVAMADERDSHNSVTELLRLAQLHMKSGVSMEEALNEIGRLSGHTELKHAFMSLAQVAKHGGEITKQLQELADAVANQRETRIEAKIKKLELEATGPVGLVFLGFLMILLIGFGAQVMKAFE